MLATLTDAEGVRNGYCNLFGILNNSSSGCLPAAPKGIGFLDRSTGALVGPEASRMTLVGALGRFSSCAVAAVRPSRKVCTIAGDWARSVYSLVHSLKSD